jgi:Xaa-Pro aminopeptidase
MIVRPAVNESTGTVTARTAFLSPQFGKGGVRMLGIRAAEELDVVTWEEHWNPYDTLRKGMFGYRSGVKIVVDEEMRDYIVCGLDTNGFQTVGLSMTVEAVRQQKSSAEVELLRSVNSGTVEAVRRMRPCLVPGLTEDEVTTILNNALLSVGFQPFFNIVLFEENAALPHGGCSPGDSYTDSIILIDVGAHYLGYSTDVCRSFFIDPPKPNSHRQVSPLARHIHVSSFLRMSTTDPPETPSLPYTPVDRTLHNLKLHMWDLLLSAQSASITYFTPNATAASVEIAARNVIFSAGYGT